MMCLGIEMWVMGWINLVYVKGDKDVGVLGSFYVCEN